MNLLELISKQQNTDKKHIFLLGDGGSGKTFHIYRAYEELLRGAQGSGCIPLYLPLNTYDSPRKKNYIKDMLIYTFLGSMGNLKSNLQNRKKLERDIFENQKYGIVLFLDGINETSCNPDGLYTEIYSLCKCSSLQLVISARHSMPGFDKSGFTMCITGRLDAAYLEKSIKNYKSLNPRLQKLVTIPLNYRLYNTINTSDNRQIRSSAELIYLYFEHQLKKLTDSSSAAFRGVTYAKLCRKIIFEFLPEKAYSNYTRADSYMIFDEDDLTGAVVSDSKKDYPAVLCEAGILHELPGRLDESPRYAFVHEMFFDYFAAHYIARLLRRQKGEKALLDTDDTVILAMIGENLGEHEFEAKRFAPERKSPVEEMFDSYRGKIDRFSAKVVSKLFEIMKHSRNGKVTADYSRLDLTMVSLMNADFCGSDFDGCTFDAQSLMPGRYKQKVIFADASPGKKYIATAGFDELIILTYAGKDVVRRYKTDGQISAIKFKNDNELFVCCEQTDELSGSHVNFSILLQPHDTTLSIYNIKDGTITVHGKTEGESVRCLSNDCESVFLVNKDKRIRIADTQSFDDIYVFDKETANFYDGLYCIDISPDRNTVCFGLFGALIILDISRNAGYIADSDVNGTYVKFLTNDTLLFAGNDNVALYDLRTKKVITSDRSFNKFASYWKKHISPGSSAKKPKDKLLETLILSNRILKGVSLTDCGIVLFTEDRFNKTELVVTEFCGKNISSESSGTLWKVPDMVVDSVDGKSSLYIFHTPFDDMLSAGIRVDFHYFSCDEGKFTEYVTIPGGKVATSAKHFAFMHGSDGCVSVRRGAELFTNTDFDNVNSLMFVSDGILAALCGFEPYVPVKSFADYFSAGKPIDFEALSREYNEKRNETADGFCPYIALWDVEQNSVKTYTLTEISERMWRFCDGNESLWEAVKQLPPKTSEAKTRSYNSDTDPVIIPHISDSTFKNIKLTNTDTPEQIFTIIRANGGII